jgi:hypothetical protein
MSHMRYSVIHYYITTVKPVHDWRLRPEFCGGCLASRRLFVGYFEKVVEKYPMKTS